MRVCRLSLFLCLALAACAPQSGRRQAPADAIAVQPRVAGAAEGVVDVAPDIALERASAALVARGFTLALLSGPAGTLEANHDNQAVSDWASCPAITVRDPFSEALRSRRVDAGEVATRVTVKATPDNATGSRVAIRALSIGSYVHGFTGTPQQSACWSTGVLEQELLAAMRAGGP